MAAPRVVPAAPRAAPMEKPPVLAAGALMRRRREGKTVWLHGHNSVREQSATSSHSDANGSFKTFLSELIYEKVIGSICFIPHRNVEANESMLDRITPRVTILNRRTLT